MADDFLSTYAPLANDIATRTGVDPSVVLGIIDTETGGGKHVLGNNIFGITPPGGVARYPDVQTAANAFITLMQTPRYRGVAVAGDPASQAAALVKGGYNTVNPQYASIVTNKALNIGKQLGYQDNSGGGQGGPAVYSTTSQPVATADQPTATSYSDSPAPAAAPQQPAQQPATTGSAKDRVLNDPALGGSSTAPAAGSSAKDRVLADPALKTTETTTTTQETPRTAETVTIDPTTGAPMMTSGPPVAPGPAAPGDTAVERIGQAAAEGWSGVPAIPRVPSNLVMSPIYNPLIAGAETALRAGGGVLRGLQQTAVETLPNQLGRDVAALPEAFPFGFNALRSPGRPPIPEAPPSPPSPRFVQEFYGEGTPSNPLAAAPVAERPAFVPPGVNIPPRPAEPPAFIPPGEARPTPVAREAAPAEAGGPQPAGAQATPTSAAQMTPEEIATQRTVADKQWLNQTQQPGVRDTAEHIPGITPNLVEQEQTVTAARELKALKNLNPELSQAEREILDRNTDLRKGFYADTVGSDVTRAGDLKAANDKINTDLANVWKGKGDANPADVHAQIGTELAGSAGDLPPLKAAMKQVADSLEGAGNDPQAMYRTHRLINYLQSKQGQLANPGYGAGDVQAALTRVKATLAKTIDDAAPGFGKAMSDYAGARGPVDAAKALQDRENGLYDSRGHMSFLKVHALMRDIIDAQKWDAPNDPLAGVSDAQMARLKALHDDLKRTANAKDLATAQGSDTAMNAVDIAKQYGKLAGRAGVEGAANLAFGPGVGSMVVRGAENLLRPISSGIAARRQVRRGMEILQPPPPNPLQPP